MPTWFNDLINFVYPDTCAGCSNPLLVSENSICTNCQIELPKTVIKDFEDNAVQKAFTGRCDFKKAAAMYVFQKGGILQNILHQIKYKGDKESAHLLGAFTGKYFKDHGFFNNIDYIVPIPLHPTKFKKRGYNQSTELALGIIEEVATLQLHETILKRDVHNTSQTSKSRFNRWLNVEHIFVLDDKIHPFENKHILLFDDVVTTGATIEAAYNQLINIKGVKISFLALAMA